MTVIRSACSRKATNTPVGFTIVELLIVIVVIAILAAITIVAYNGIQARARASATTTALTQAKRKLELYKVDNTTYPTSGNLANAGITDTANATYQYTSATGANYCLTATNGTTSYYVDSTTQSTPTQGGCSGHGQGGVAAVTNLSYASLIEPRGAVSFYSKDNITWNGESWDAQVTATVGGHGLRARFGASPDETTGSYYTGAIEVGNPNAVSITVSIDMGDVGSAMVVIPPGEKRELSMAATRTWDSVYRFLDINASSSNPSAVNYLFVVRHPTILHGNYGTIPTRTGSSPNWVWNGAANASTSTGPPL